MNQKLNDIHTVSKIVSERLGVKKSLVSHIASDYFRNCAEQMKTLSTFKIVIPGFLRFKAKKTALKDYVHRSSMVKEEKKNEYVDMKVERVNEMLNLIERYEQRHKNRLRKKRETEQNGQNN